jgi:FtsP/CotA-like multicopper oxidase with cupredoxin domain
MPTVVGEVDHAKNGFNPTAILTDFDPGLVSKLPNGQTLHEYTIIAQDTLIEVAPGLKFAAWTYNGRIPGPTIRVRQGDRVRIKFFNASDHEHRSFPRHPSRRHGRCV